MGGSLRRLPGPCPMAQSRHARHEYRTGLDPFPRAAALGPAGRDSAAAGPGPAALDRPRPMAPDDPDGHQRPAGAAQDLQRPDRLPLVLLPPGARRALLRALLRREEGPPPLRDGGRQGPDPAEPDLDSVRRLGEIGQRGPQEAGRVTEVAKALVAGIAEDAAHLAAGVVVVDVKPRVEFALADRAASILPLKQRSELGSAQPVLGPQPRRSLVVAKPLRMRLAPPYSEGDG